MVYIMATMLRQKIQFGVLLLSRRINENKRKTAGRNLGDRIISSLLGIRVLLSSQVICHIADGLYQLQKLYSTQFAIS